ncbi:MAG: 2,4'-dihydroxyacetophenone dioxygenase family protein [Gammaproteobacteria bacterium]
MLMNHGSAVIPAAILRQESDLPMVEISPGVAIQLLQVDFDHNTRVTRAQLAPGLKLRTHIHTGHVFAWTLAGTWHYLEYPENSEANSYLYEPAGSIHTLYVPEDSTQPADVIFIVHGSNIELGATGEVEGATSAMDIARAYLRACQEKGIPRPDVIGLPPDWEG